VEHAASVRRHVAETHADEDGNVQLNCPGSNKAASILFLSLENKMHVAIWGKIDSVNSCSSFF
jgi:hypothetical protein